MTAKVKKTIILLPNNKIFAVSLPDFNYIYIYN